METVNNVHHADFGKHVEGPASKVVSQTTLTADDRIRQGRDAWAKLCRQNILGDWLTFGEGLALGQAFATRKAGAAVGRTYNKVLRDWHDQHSYKLLDKGLRNKVLECVKHRIEILRWLDTLEESKRVRLNYPPTVLSAWRRATGLLPPAARRGLREILAAAGIETFLAEMPEGWREQLEARVTRNDQALTLQRTHSRPLSGLLRKIITHMDDGESLTVIAGEIADKILIEGREPRDLAVYFHRTAARRSAQ